MTTVRTILARKGSTVHSVQAGDTVLAAARVMNERGIGGVVIQERGEMVGIFTERDILRRVVAEQKDPSQTTVRDVMTAPVVTCNPDTPLEDCMQVMSARRNRHLPVVSEDGLCGMLTTGDILAYQVQEHEDTIQHLNNYIHDLR